MSSPSSDPIRGSVFAVQRYCTHDGPGIRTTIFLKGCPLRCVWCHNPESQAFGSEISYSESACLSCGACVVSCPHGAQRMEAGKHIFDRSLCVRCGRCASVCPSALEVFGRLLTVDEALAEALEDRPFYGENGGITLSGGEPFAQPDFALALLRRAKEQGIGTAVETCGACDFAVLAAAMPYVDTFLFDYKETDPEKHRLFTGADNRRILENLKKLVAAGANIVLRCPIIPGYNDTAAHLAGIADCANRFSVRRIELEPGHTIGEAKKKLLGVAVPSALFEPPSPETVSGWLDTLGRLTSVPAKIS